MKSDHTHFSDSISDIRKTLRTIRANLPKDFRQKNSSIIAKKVINSAIFKQSINIAIYLPTEGEVETKSIIKSIWKNNKLCFLPRIKSFKEKTIDFLRYDNGDILAKNEYGIAEPTYDEKKIITPHGLDLVIVPLVGFNDDFFRIGRGAGFYDKTFADKLPHRRDAIHRVSNITNPFLLGIAYEFQRTFFKPNSRDVQLQLVITEK